jgi:adenylosuccinate lyase
LFETILTVLVDFGAYPAVIEAELARNLPFLATTRVLMASVAAGVGREEAHEIIKEHAVGAALDRRERPDEAVDLVARLGADERLRLGPDVVAKLVSDPMEFTGAAGTQVDAVAARIAEIVSSHPEAAAYRPAPIL